MTLNTVISITVRICMIFGVLVGFLLGWLIPRFGAWFFLALVIWFVYLTIRDVEREQKSL